MLPAAPCRSFIPLETHQPIRERQHGQTLELKHKGCMQYAQGTVKTHHWSLTCMLSGAKVLMQQLVSMAAFPAGLDSGKYHSRVSGVSLASL